VIAYFLSFIVDRERGKLILDIPGSICDLRYTINDTIFTLKCSSISADQIPAFAGHKSRITYQLLMAWSWIFIFIPDLKYNAFRIVLSIRGQWFMNPGHAGSGFHLWIKLFSESSVNIS
jgi:hypothetical protein